MISEEMPMIWAHALVETIIYNRDLDIYYARVCDDLYVANCTHDDPLLPLYEDLAIFTDSLMAIALRQDMSEFGTMHAAAMLDVVDILIRSVRDRLVSKYGYSIVDVLQALAKVKSRRDKVREVLVGTASHN